MHRSPRHISLATAACALAVMLLHLGSWVSLRAETPAATSTLQDLLRVQMAVQTALPLVRTALVALETQDGAASGVIVSPDGLVFTAAHVVSDAKKQPRPGMKVKIFLHDGLESKGTALGMDVATDAAMIQLDGKRKDWPFVELRRTGPEVLPGDWCFALGHPGGHDEKRGDVLRVGKVIKVMPNGLQSDCVLMGGDSGGPLFDLKGQLIGIHSQIWEGRDQNVHVSLAPFVRSWDIMKESEVVRSWAMGSGGWLGVATRDGDNGAVEVASVADQSPAARVGLRSGDALVALDRRPVRTQSQFSAAIRSRAAGDSVVLLVRNRSGERTLTIKLATRPEE